MYPCSMGINQCKDDKENVSEDLYQNEFMVVKYWMIYQRQFEHSSHIMLW